MKRFAALVVAIFLCTPGIADAEKKIPDFSDYLVDDARVLRPEVVNQVNAELADYERRTTNQIAILVVPTTGDQSIEDYGADVGNAWGVGQEGRDNGVLMVLAMNDRAGRIDVGRGLEGELTDLQAKSVLDDHVFPRLAAGDPNEAVLQGQRAIRTQLRDSQVGVPPPVITRPVRDQPSSGWGSLVFPIILFLLFSIAGAAARRRRRRGFGGFGGGFGSGFGTGIFYGGMNGWGSGGGFGSGGGSGFGGGFGGGGGGSFGGGGASGNW